MMARMAQPSRVGDLLAGKYRLDALLGSGGVGDVYRAQNTLIGRTVAIKVLKAEHATDDSVVERFLREAKAANLARHPNVVDVLDVGLDDEGVPFIVQEFLEGMDLGQHLKRSNGALPYRQVLELMIPVVEAVGLAHARGVVHRDLKPENVFLARVGGAVVPKLLDFGISYIKPQPGDVRMTRTGMTVGTPAYMSPEQLEGTAGVDVRTDVWALGVILYESLAGRLPFE
ncbi:MAG: serine/threonine protein kinase, partial [Deltaproteobacteria bacterium HGW-Deltaproteobacteria-20]